LIVELGFFILGFLIVFFGGIYYLYNWNLFDFEDEESWLE
tara:strand:- start:593 stop:712 length:120 start_codon:yes stop_codon:yes gene_type:complete